MSFLSGQSQYTTDVSSKENIMTALYEVISGDAGEKRDWDRFKNLFTADARLIPSGKNQDGEMYYRVWTPQEYVEKAGVNLEKNGFFEKEIHSVTEEYGSLVHIWSSYESFRTSKDTAPFSRGINSIQLMNDGARWWIMQIYWLGETGDNPLPDKYLGH